ncbi:hypothetical protein J0383_07955 [Flavobacterium endoglycinae]|uniref:Uncharacterized protein n=1 Tax=Flavobacterium endoglycinae TaxID=2816357 RepID=A0ABX7QJC9_9FLAO|nr:hypothetical protein [Flavobacterium endoglycinae]QSW90733.1 hypothetical protein J0383_07955 [Flavobacterium endoglycinae]
MMKIYLPPPRLVDLGLVLQYDKEVFKCELKEENFLTWNERLLINRERARIMANDHSYKQDIVLEYKILNILLIIKQTHWKPLKTIEYAKNF